jgi:multicomponent K+:H+ antiporter subunit F
MLSYALAFAITCFAIALLLTLFRLVTASTMADRILAVDTMVVIVIALLVLYGIHSGSGLNFEAAILFAMTGFISTVAFCKFLLRGSIIE